MGRGLARYGLLGSLTLGLILAGAIVPPRFISAQLLLPGALSRGVANQISGPLAATAPVRIVEFAFEPSSLTIAAGDTVQWTNEGELAHTSTADMGLWDSGLLAAGQMSGYGRVAGQSFSVTFDTVGTYGYFCRVHPFVRGTVTVRTQTPPTPTPTASATATPVAPPTATRPPTVQATATPTPSTPGVPTATASAIGPVGGRGFTLRAGGGGGTALSWTGGTAQSSYVLLRVSGTGAASIPLSGTATGHVDTAGAAEPFSCYLLVPASGSSALGISDLLCVIRNLRSGIAPSDLGIRLDAGTATLSWTPAGGQDGYVLAPLGGSAVVLDGNATSANQPVVGTTCLLLVPTLRGAPIGNTDVVCGAAGLGTLDNAG